MPKKAEGARDTLHEQTTLSKVLALRHKTHCSLFSRCRHYLCAGGDKDQCEDTAEHRSLCNFCGSGQVLVLESVVHTKKIGKTSIKTVAYTPTFCHSRVSTSRVPRHMFGHIRQMRGGEKLQAAGEDSAQWSPILDPEEEGLACPGNSVPDRTHYPPSRCIIPTGTSGS